MISRQLSILALIFVLTSSAILLAQGSEGELLDSIAVPEPGTLLLVGGGMYLIGRNLRKRVRR